MYVSVPCVCLLLSKARRTSDSLEIELQMIVSCHMGARNWSWALCKRATSYLNCWHSTLIFIFTSNYSVKLQKWSDVAWSQHSELFQFPLIFLFHWLLSKCNHFVSNILKCIFYFFPISLSFIPFVWQIYSVLVTVLLLWLNTMTRATYESFNWANGFREFRMAEWRHGSRHR